MANESNRTYITVANYGKQAMESQWPNLQTTPYKSDRKKPPCDVQQDVEKEIYKTPNRKAKKGNPVPEKKLGKKRINQQRTTREG